MFVQLEEAVTGMRIPLHGAALAEAIRLRDRLDSHIAVAVGEFERAGLWEVEGATSMAAWLRDRGGVAKQHAGGMRVTGKRLLQLPGVAVAAQSGRLSGGQVQAIVAAVSDDTVSVFAVQESELVPVLAGLSPADTITVLSQWQTRAQALVGDGEVEEEPVRSLHHSRTLDNRWEGSWSFDAEGGATVDTAIQLATTKDLEGDPVRCAAQRRADAIVDICREFLDNQHGRPGGGRHRPHVNVVLALDAAGHPDTARIVDGPELSTQSMQRLLCDCTFHRIVMEGGSTVFDLGRSTRTIPARLWNGLVVRDQHCRFPGCDRPPHWCEAHHVVPWEHGGTTDAGNLALSKGAFT